MAFDFAPLLAFDFVSLWKQASIVSTGAFGILALLVEYKDKDTKRITKWGRISLIGILASTVLGVIAQNLEQSNQERGRAIAAKQTLELLQNTNQTVKGIERVLSPLDDVRVSAELTISCDTPAYRDFCNAAEDKDSLSNPSIMDKWPGPKFADVMLYIRFFRNPKSAQDFIDFRSAWYGENGDLLLWASACHGCVPKQHLWVLVHGTSYVELRMKEVVPINVVRTANIVSALDFAGTVMVISTNDRAFEWMTLVKFALIFKNGQCVASNDGASFTKTKHPDGDIVYRHIFSQQVEQSGCTQWPFG
jgi:hypothetical protein